jgi:nitroreductase
LNPVLDNIITRRSIRSFTNKQISAEDLNTILLAGSYAPNGMGTQSWRFTAVQGPATMKKVNEAIRQTLLSIPIVAETHPYVASLIEKARDENANFSYHAPTFIIVSNLKDNGNAMPDSALAIGNMMLAAHSLGIGSCWVNQLPGLTHMPLIRELLTELDIPENHVVYGSVVMGYPADEPKMADPRKDVIRIFTN